MTTQVVSICNGLGGMALEPKEAEAIANLIEQATQGLVQSQDVPLLATASKVCNLLRGRQPYWPQNYQPTGKKGRGWVGIEPV